MEALITVAIISGIALLLKLAQWGDRVLDKKSGYDKLTKKERKELEKKKTQEWAEKMAEKTPNWVTAFFLLGIVFLVFKGCSSISINLDGNKDREAYYVCKGFIKKRLNDPDSLDFPDSDTAHITSNGNTYDIAGKFRANNALGVKIQTSYACTVVENKDRGTWALKYLSEF